MFAGVAPELVVLGVGDAGHALGDPFLRDGVVALQAVLDVGVRGGAERVPGAPRLYGAVGATSRFWTPDLGSTASRRFTRVVVSPFSAPGAIVKSPGEAAPPGEVQARVVNGEAGASVVRGSWIQLCGAVGGRSSAWAGAARPVNASEAVAAAVSHARRMRRVGMWGCLRCSWVSKSNGEFQNA